MEKTALQKRCEELLPVIQAVAEGKVIECRRFGEKWEAKDPNFTVFWHDSQYRVKPEPKYRPFTPEEALKLCGRKVRHDFVAGDRDILGVSPNGVFIYGIGLGERSCEKFADLLRLYKFDDGTPCGVLVSE